MRPCKRSPAEVSTLPSNWPMQAKVESNPMAATNSAYRPCPAGPSPRAIRIPVAIDAPDWAAWLANVCRKAELTFTRCS